MHKAVGIDLGTTYCTVATIDASGNPVTLENAEGDPLTPSAVCFDQNEIIIGKEAVKASAFLPNEYFECFKREMGEGASVSVRGMSLPVEALSALLLENLKQNAEEKVGSFQDVVITVPAYFDENRRQTTAQAATRAGLNPISIINEPTAAALAFAHQHNIENEIVLVFDLGGGTFDASLVKLAEKEYQTIATDGDVKLGGKDFDDRLVDYFSNEFRNAHGIDPREVPEDRAQLYRDVEEIKRSLSKVDKANYSMAFAGMRLRTSIERETFESLTQDLVVRMKTTTELLVMESDLEWEQIDRIIVVGGAARMPAIQKMLTEISDTPVDYSMNPDLVVGHGAALLCHYIINQKTNSSFNLVDVNSHSIGIQGLDTTTNRRTNRILIPKNTSLPFSVAGDFVTARDGQASVMVRVLEGESINPSDCIQLGECVITNLPENLEAGNKVRVYLTLDVGGNLSVAAIIPKTRQSTSAVINRNRSQTLDSLDEYRRQIYGHAEAADVNLIQKLDQLFETIGTRSWLSTNFGDSPARQSVMDVFEQSKTIKSEIQSLREQQIKSDSRIKASELSAQLSRLSRILKSQQMEIRYRIIDFGRIVVEENLESEELEELANDARRVIDTLTSTQG